uniref:RRM domain-containing protein n=1 Tax=Alexandrium monilatum TaxID=311494 RepID=A0A7S4RVT2_9DINO
MAHLYQELTPQTQYIDKKSGFSKEKWQEAIKVSRTLYVGNLSFFTTEEQIHELFSRCGEVKRVVMGLNRYKKSPCGFCFVEFFTHEQAAQAVNLLNKTNFDDRLIRVDWDAGISDGRQFGRGESGDQWRDDFRGDFDVARGGQGRNLLRKIDDLPGKQVYVGKRRQDHGRFGAQAGAAPQDAGEPANKRARQRGPAGGAPGAWGGFPGYPMPGFDAYGLPMAFGANPAFGFFGPAKGKAKGGCPGAGHEAFGTANLVYAYNGAAPGKGGKGKTGDRGAKPRGKGGSERQEERDGDGQRPREPPAEERRGRSRSASSGRRRRNDED